MNKFFRKSTVILTDHYLIRDLASRYAVDFVVEFHTKTVRLAWLKSLRQLPRRTFPCGCPTFGQFATGNKNDSMFQFYVLRTKIFSCQVSTCCRQKPYVRIDSRYCMTADVSYILIFDRGNNFSETPTGGYIASINTKKLLV